jgi:hypothetical protein
VIIMTNEDERKDFMKEIIDPNTPLIHHIPPNALVRAHLQLAKYSPVPLPKLMPSGRAT